MITGESLFLDIAKISITIAGFTGVVAAVRHPRDIPWKANEVNGLKLMIEHSLAAVLFGLLPSLTYLYKPDEGWDWLVSSVILAAFFLYALLIQIVRIQHSSSIGHPPRRFRLLLLEFFVVTVGVMYLQIHNALVWHGAIAYAIGCLWLLVAACRQFSIFLLDMKQS